MWLCLYGACPRAILNNDSLPDLYFSINQVNDRLSRIWGDMPDKEIPRSVGFDTWGLSHRICLADGHRDGQLDVSAG